MNQSNSHDSVNGPNALDLLKADHRKVQALFKQFEEKKDDMSPSEKYELAKKVCGELLIHMSIEESVFYPAVRKAIDDDDMMNEAEVEHDAARVLIEDIGKLDPSDPMFSAKLKVLGEEIDHHVKEEETEMFEEAQKAEVDLDLLGAKLKSAKADMRREVGLPPE